MLTLKKISQWLVWIQANNIKPRRLIAHPCVWLPWPPFHMCHCLRKFGNIRCSARENINHIQVWKISHSFSTTVQTDGTKNKTDIRECLSKQQTAEKRGSTSNKYDLSSPTLPSCINHWQTYRFSLYFPSCHLYCTLAHANQNEWHIHIYLITQSALFCVLPCYLWPLDLARLALLYVWVKMQIHTHSYSYFFMYILTVFSKTRWYIIYSKSV